MTGPARPRGVFAGLATLDVVHRLHVAPGPDEKATAHRQDVAAGGPAAGAALAFAALGGSATLLTALGIHPVADLIRADLVGVDVLDGAPPGFVPPVSGVRVSPAGRSVTSPDATGRSAGWSVSAGGLAAVTAAVAAAGVVVLDGHHPQLARTVIRVAGEFGVPVVLDLGRPKPVFTELLPRADVAVAAAGWEVGDLATAGPTLVAVTAGAGPIVWRTASGRGEVVPPVVTAVDTLGAGDVFHGAVAFAVAQHGLSAAIADWPGVLTFAAAVAGVRVTTVGPLTWRSDARLVELARWRGC